MWISLRLSSLGFVSFLKRSIRSSAKYGSFQPVFLQIFFLHNTLLFWDANNMSVGSFGIVLQVSETLFTFTIPFLCVLHWILSINPSPTSLTISSITSILLLNLFIDILTYVFFNAKTSIWFFVFLFCLAEIFYLFVHFNRVQTYFLEHGCNSYFKLFLR